MLCKPRVWHIAGFYLNGIGELGKVGQGKPGAGRRDKEPSYRGSGGLSAGMTLRG